MRAYVSSRCRRESLLVSGLVLAVVLLGEHFTPPLLVASVAILAGVSIAQRA